MKTLYVKNISKWPKIIWLVRGPTKWGQTAMYAAPKSIIVQSLSHIRLLATPWTAARQVSLSFTISRSLLKLISIESMMLSNHLILCCPLLLLPSIFPSIRVFFSDLALHIRWLKYWSFSFSNFLSIEYSGLISSRVDRFDLAVHGTLKSLLQHHTLKAWHWAFVVYFSLSCCSEIVETRFAIGRTLSGLLH